MSSTRRLLLSLLVLLGCGLLALLSPLLERVRRQYFEAAEEPMVDEANLFAALLEDSAQESGALDVTAMRRAFAAAQERMFEARIYNLTKRRVDTNMYVTDRRGRVIFDSNGGRAEGQNYMTKRDVGYSLLGEYGARSTLDPEGDSRSYVMFVGAPIRWHGQIIGMVSVSKAQRSLYEFIAETRAQMLWLGGVIFLVVAAGAVVITRRYTQPIERLASYARAIGRGERIAPPRLDLPEVATLGRAFEEMRDALSGRRYVEAYVQSLTHEMKSPVAAIRGASELLREGMPAERAERFLANIDAEAQRLQRIIDRLLGLSAIETRKSLERPESVALADLAEAVGAQFRPAAEAREVRLEYQFSSRPSIVGETFLLEIALANLLQNAIDFSPAGGLVTIGIACADDAPWVELRVEDEGPGIPGYALPRLFERFYSLQHPSTGRKSSGLGLCLVKEAIDLHQGTVSIANRVGRSGTRAVIRFFLGEARAVATGTATLPGGESGRDGQDAE